MLNWIKNQPYQQYFSSVILLSDEKSSDSIQRLYMSFFDCKEMIFDKEYAFTNYASDPSKSIRFKNFDELIKFINDIIFDDCVRNGSSFIFCYYGKDLFFKTLPINAKLNNISLQQYYLEFIDLRNELYEFMMRDFPFINSQLQGDFDRLLPLMCAALKIFNTGTDYLKNQHDCLKQIIVLLLQNQHNFNFPTIMNPQIIYGQKLYLNPPWYNKLPQAIQDVRYLRIRGIPFNYSKKDIIDFYEFQQFNTQDITLKENDQGLFNGEIIMRFEDETQYDKVRKSDKFYMKNRYIEVFESTVDEFKQDNEPQKPQGKSQTQQLYYLKLRGLPWSCGRKEIKSFLGDNKWIKQIDIIYEKNGRAKGECFVVVDNETECENLKYKYDKKNLGNRYVEIFISSAKEYNNAVRPKGQSKSRSRSGSPFKNFK